ncbi:MAG: ABC transporter permease [Caldilinea sp.]|nr:ABC transporter permease [Caldilinea sp.]MDW8439080.1 ABC transporter permease [Caldilineaceae bacterium]
MESFLRTFSDQTINGLVIGNIYAFIAVGLALIFGVGNLINFAHGSVFMVGAYVGWVCMTWWNLPLAVAFVVVTLVCALVGVAIERFALYPLRGAPPIAPLLATIGVSFMIDQAVQLLFSRNPHAFPNPLIEHRFQVGGVTVGAIDLLIAGVGVAAALTLYSFLRFTRWGWALRATAQDREAALQMGVNVNAVNRMTFAIAAALGGIAGLLVGMYFNTVYPTMSFQATFKGFAAVVLGGLGNVPGAVLGGLLLGLIESYGVAIFGATYRNLFAFIILIAVLVWRPNGLFSLKPRVTQEPLTGTFIAKGRPVPTPKWLIATLIGVAFVVPILAPNPYLLQILTNAWLLGMVALSVTLVTGTAGQTSLGQAGFMAIGAYASALLVLRLGWPFELSMIAAAFISAILGTLLVFPAFRLRAAYIAIATLAIGEIVNQVILNWEGLTQGAMGIAGLPPPSLLGWQMIRPHEIYYFSLALLCLAALVQWRLVRSPLGRTWRSLREDEVAAQAFGVNLNRYKTLAFGVAAWLAGLSGAVTGHMYTYISHETFTNTTSILALTMVILGGMGNLLGAIVGAVVLTALPEVFRGLADYRYLVYGLTLLLVIRFRPQGLLGTD